MSGGRGMDGQVEPPACSATLQSWGQALEIASPALRFPGVPAGAGSWLSSSDLQMVPGVPGAVRAWELQGGASQGGWHCGWGSWGYVGGCTPGQGATQVTTSAALKGTGGRFLMPSLRTSCPSHWEGSACAQCRPRALSVALF